MKYGHLCDTVYLGVLLVFVCTVVDLKASPTAMTARGYLEGNAPNRSDITLPTIPKTRWTSNGVAAYAVELTLITAGFSTACSQGPYACIGAGIAAVIAIFLSRATNSGERPILSDIQWHVSPNITHRALEVALQMSQDVGAPVHILSRHVKGLHTDVFAHRIGFYNSLRAHTKRIHSEFEKRQGISSQGDNGDDTWETYYWGASNQGQGQYYDHNMEDIDNVAGSIASAVTNADAHLLCLTLVDAQGNGVAAGFFDFSVGNPDYLTQDQGYNFEGQCANYDSSWGIPTPQFPNDARTQ